MRQSLPHSPAPPRPPGHGLARILSKLGACSRSEGERLVLSGRVTVDGIVVRDPDRRTDPAHARIEIDGAPVGAAAPVYLMLNKPRGLVTTRDDPQGRGTVYDCLADLDLPHVAPVGRLDKASEGLLLFTNDTLWADRVLDGEAAPQKTYHVKIDRPTEDALVAALRDGVVDRGERLAALSVRPLREGLKHGWLEIVLDEGRNRHIRRLLAAHGVETLRLMRVAIGELRLGPLPKGQCRPLTAAEIEALAPPGSSPQKHSS